MSRTLSAGIAGAILDTKVQRTVHLLTFAVGIATYRFAQDAVRFAGFDYLPYLRLDAPLRYTQKLQLQPTRLKLDNIDLETAELLQQEAGDIQGAEATLTRLYLGINEGLILAIAQITEFEVDERDAALTLSGDLDPTAATIPGRKYSALSSEDGRTFDEWNGEGSGHLFDGFIHITRELTKAVEGQNSLPPDVGEGNLADLLD